MLFEIQSNHSKNGPVYMTCMFLPVSIFSPDRSDVVCKYIIDIMIVKHCLCNYCTNNPYL